MGKRQENFSGYSQKEAVELLSDLHDQALEKGLVGHGAFAPCPSNPNKYQVWFEEGVKANPLPPEVERSI